MMKICRECGFIKSDSYIYCPECHKRLDHLDDWEGE